MYRNIATVSGVKVTSKLKALKLNATRKKMNLQSMNWISKTDNYYFINGCIPVETYNRLVKAYILFVENHSKKSHLYTIKKPYIEI